MSSAREEPQSPYLLAPGPVRRALMREQGISVCLLDYSDQEWAVVQAARAGTDVQAPRAGETGPAARLA